MLPPVVMIRAKAVGVPLLLGLLAGAALLPGCFSSCTGKSAVPAAPPSVQTPPSPLPSPVVQTPPSPAPGPAVQTPEAPVSFDSPEETAARKEDPPPTGLTLEGMRAIRDGMSYEEVKEKIGVPGALIAGTDKASNVYRWNEAGLSFLARFEDGKLTRKSIITPEGDEYPAETDERRTIDKELYDGIRAGMTFEEVMERIGIEAQPINKTGANVTIYTWRDAGGSSFTARFEDGKLVRKTGLYVAKTGGTEKAEEGAEKAQEPAEPDEPGDAAKAGEPSAGDAPADDAPAGNGAAASETPPPGPRKGRVSVAGSSRRERQAESADGKQDRSYRPRAQLPRNMHRLREGSYEIRIHNTAESGAKAAVVSQEGATEMTIPAGGQQSIFVNQGDYVVQFIYDNDPYTLHKGGVIAIGQWMTDMEVFLFGDAYDVQVLDRATDRPASRRRTPSLKDEFSR